MRGEPEFTRRKGSGGPCRFSKCKQPARCKGWCDVHYRQARNGVELVPITPRGPKPAVRNEHRLVGNLCQPHRSGMPEWLKGIPFFVAGCLTCEKKRTDGKVTGNEPPPPTHREMMASRGGKARRLAQLRVKVREPGATL